MKPEDQLLFACTRIDLQGEHRQIILELSQRYTIAWEVVFSKAEKHGVAALAYINLCQRHDLNLGIPEQVANHYRMFMLRNSVWKEQRSQKLLQALVYFQGFSSDVMLFKGGVLDLLVYDSPTYVTSQDIDIVLRRKKDQFTGTELQEIMDFLHRTGIEYDFFEHHDMTINGTLPVDFERIWREASVIDFRGQPLWIMSPEDMVISLCINSCRKRFFRLKSLLDIAETVHKFSDLKWDDIYSKAKAYDCENIVYAAFLVTARTLGCSLPDGWLESFEISRFREASIRGVIDWLIRNTSLPASPNAGLEILGQHFDLSLVLPYTAYRGYQIWHKLFWEIFSAN